MKTPVCRSIILAMLLLFAIAAATIALSQVPYTDRTNLKGLYSFKIQWSLEDAGAGNSPLIRRDSRFGPAFFTAIQEQLGLRLEPAKAPVDFIIIKSVQKPLIK